MARSALIVGLAPMVALLGFMLFIMTVNGDLLTIDTWDHAFARLLDAFGLGEACKKQ